MKDSEVEITQSKAPRSHAKVPKGRRGTEYLANERTFLAWIRTSIAVVSMGFVITRLGGPWMERWIGLKHNSSHTSLIMGTALMGFGACLAVLAVWRYHVVNRAIEQGQVKADRWLVIFVAALVVCISFGMISFMLLAE